LSSERVETGSLLMTGLPGLELDSSTVNLIERYGVNNFIIFSRNVADPPQLQKLCRDLAETCEKQGLQPPLIAIDQEGGSVTRLPEPWTQFPDQRILAESDNPEEMLADYAGTCARELLTTGINLNFAPVLDVCPGGRNYFMERRSLGEDPELVARLGCLVIAEMQKGGVAACAKHFPGLGGAILDPHLVLPTVDRSLELIRSQDLVPFMAAAAAGVASIMTSHTIYPALDQDLPATLSPKILTGLLRDELGYDGLVITDDLEMGAIENTETVAEAALLSFKAGADLLLVCHDHDKVRDTVKTMGEAVVNGQIGEEMLLTARQRINKVRENLSVS